MGKYTCLICQKEFNSESGVKYHISKTHSQVGQYQWETSHTDIKHAFIFISSFVFDYSDSNRMSLGAFFSNSINFSL